MYASVSGGILMNNACLPSANLEKSIPGHDIIFSIPSEFNTWILALVVVLILVAVPPELIPLVVYAFLAKCFIGKDSIILSNGLSSSSLIGAYFWNISSTLPICFSSSFASMQTYNINACIIDTADWYHIGSFPFFAS